MLEESVLAADVDQLVETQLRNHSTSLTACCRKPVGGRTITSGEYLSGYNERRGIGTKVLEEVCNAVKENKGVRAGFRGSEFVVSKALGESISVRWCKPEQRHTHDDEENGKNGEAHKLDGFATPGIDQQEGSPVPGNETRNRENEVSNANVVQSLVDIERGISGSSAATEINSSQDGRAIETETVKGDLERRENRGATSVLD